MASDGDDQEACDEIYEWLQREYGLLVADFAPGHWKLEQLQTVLSGIHDMLKGLSWTAEQFRDHIGSFSIYQSQAEKGLALTGWVDAVTVGYSITFYQRAFSSGLDAFKHLFVHETAHVWDWNTGGTTSSGMMQATQSTYEFLSYKPGGDTTRYGASNHFEDWAESVTKTVYGSEYKPDQSIDQTRTDYVHARAAAS